MPQAGAAFLILEEEGMFSASLLEVSFDQILGTCFLVQSLEYISSKWRKQWKKIKMCTLRGQDPRKFICRWTKGRQDFPS